MELRRRSLLTAVARLSLLSALSVVLGSCQGPSGGGTGTAGDVQGPFWTQYTLVVERDMARSTNYRSGEAPRTIPVNTEVTVTGSRKGRVEIQPKDGARFTFEHLPKHTRDTYDEAFSKAFGRSPVDLTRFSDEDRAAILRGEARVGMDRETLLVALGPPPASKTASLESNPWVYMSTRWVSFGVRFGEDGRVLEIGR